MDADELKLVRRAKRGDQEAFRTLMERYKRRVYAIVYGMVRDPELALDVSQEAFLKVYRYLGTFQGSSSFYTWLYRIVVNLCIDHLRKEGKHDTVDYDDMLLRREADDAEAEIVPSTLRNDPLRNLDRKELGEQLGKAFGSLSEKHRAVLLLREVEGLSYEDMARTLKIHKGTVMSRLHHARKNVQRALRGYLKERGNTDLAPQDGGSSDDEESEDAKVHRASSAPGA
jgi:RNA polymerase sigma-70 factor (ECF subfamily)